MYWKRWLTALVIIPPFLLLIFKGGQLLFTLVIVAVCILCLLEYFRICFTGHTPAVPIGFSLWGFLSGATIVFFAYRQQHLAMMVTLAVNLIGTALLSIQRFKTSEDAPVVAAKQVCGTLYIPLTASFVVMLHASPDGPLWVFLLFWVIAWGDTGALYVGSTFGRHKLCPAVSPKKTVEGAVGGLMSNLVAAWIVKLWLFDGMSAVTCTLFALLVGMAGQVGDLFESLFKRASGVKDSGTLLPGHGGFLDRLDAVLMAAPVAFLIKEISLP